MIVHSEGTVKIKLRFAKNGRKYIEKQELIDLFEKYNSAYKIAEVLGLSQTMIQNAKDQLEITFDGRPKANSDKEKCDRHSKILKEKYASGEYEAYWTGKKQSESHIENRVKHFRNKPAWNSGIEMVDRIIVNCILCGKEIITTKKRKRITCSADCQHEYYRIYYKGDKFSGINNPNYGNGQKMKDTWARGCYDNRPLPEYSWAGLHYYKNFTMRSNWEVLYATYLDYIGYDWEYEPKRFILSDGRQYHPDFYIKEIDLYIEVKGWWREGVKEKFNQFLQEFPDIKIIVEDDINSWKIN